MAYPKVAKVVRDVLRTRLKHGTTTKQATTLEAWKKIERTGGPSKYGIGAAALTMAMQRIIEVEVTRQLKMPLTDHEKEFVLPATARAELKDIVNKVPRWIAIEDGREALWMSTLKARPEHWRANGALKEKKAEQTEAKADVSNEVAMFLALNGFASLEEAMRKGV